MQNPESRPPLEGYALDDRRTDRYTFMSMKALIRYFSSWMEEEEIQDVIDESKPGFKLRTGSDKKETALQMIKKVEYALVRLLRKGAGR